MTISPDEREPRPVSDGLILRRGSGAPLQALAPGAG